MEKTIMVLDDDEAILNVMRLQLENEGYYVVTAISIDDGLIEYHITQPDLLFLDYMLGPGATGMDFLSMLRDHFRLSTQQEKQAKIILMSAYPYNLKDVEGLRIDATMGKPYDLENMLALVERLLRTTTGELAVVGGG